MKKKLTIQVPNVDIEEYNKTLVDNNEDLNIIDYFSRVHKLFFKTVDISFMNYFIELSHPSKKNSFIISEKELRKYGILNDHIRLKDIIRKYNLVHDSDWIYYQEEEENKSKQRKSLLGSIFNVDDIVEYNTKKVVLFTPYSFKKMIIQSNQSCYIDYYLLLEDVFRFYYEYQFLYKSKLESNTKREINILKKELDALKETTKKMTPIIEVLEECTIDLREIQDVSSNKINKIKKEIISYSGQE
jgi:hypothetical protein